MADTIKIFIRLLLAVAIVVAQEQIKPRSNEIKNGNQSIIELLPKNLQKMIKELGLNDVNLDRELKGIGSLLGTNTISETIDSIRDLASSVDGLELIESFLKSYKGDKKKVKAKKPMKLHSRIPYSRFISLPRKYLRQVGSFVDRTHTNLDILSAVASRPQPESSLLSYFTSWISSFLPGYKTKTRNTSKQIIPARIMYIVNPVKLPPSHFQVIKPPQNVYQYDPTTPQHAGSFRVPNVIQNQISRLPLTDRNVPKPHLNSYGHEIKTQGSGSENKPPVTLDNPEINESRSDFQPTRASGIHSHATGNIHKMDSTAIDAAINAKYISNYLDESRVINDISALTTSQFLNPEDEIIK